MKRVRDVTSDLTVRASQMPRGEYDNEAELERQKAAECLFYLYYSVSRGRGRRGGGY